MKKRPVTKQDALETWMADEIADLARTLPAPKAGLLVLDAQMTDLETRCAIRQTRINDKSAQPKDIHPAPAPRPIKKSARNNQPKI